MPRRHEEAPLRLRRAWVWVADAEGRWRRAMRLLLQDGLAAQRAATRWVGEDHDGHEGRAGPAGGPAGAPGLAAAAYVRVSTERQAGQQTIEQQLERVRAYALERGWPLDEARLYRDDGHSGARLNRPGLDRLRDAVGRGEVDVVLVTSPDRLVRRYAYQVWLLEEFERAGCRVVFLDRPPSDDPQDALLLQIRGAVAEYERTVIADRMRRGRLAALRAGRLLPWSRRPFGYRLDPVRPRDPAGLRVDEAEAAVVRDVFAWYAEEGLTLRAVARRLTDAQVPTALGRPRCSTAGVRKLLSNHGYRGVAYGNQQQMVPPRRRRPLVRQATPAPGNTTVRRRPAAEWIGVAVPALVSDDLFERAQARLARNREWAPRNTRGDYLLRRLVSCGRCDLAHRIGTNGRSAFYACPGKAGDSTRGQRGVCHTSLIATGRLDEAVWADVCRLLRDPTVLAESVRRARQGWLHEGAQAGRWQALQRREAELQRQVERLVDAYAAGALSLEELLTRRGRLDARLAAVGREAAALAATADHHQRLDAVATQLEAFRATLARGLETADFARRREIVELLIERVVVDAPQVEIRYALPLGGTAVRQGGLRAHHPGDVGRVDAPVQHGPRLRRGVQPLRDAPAGAEPARRAGPPPAEGEGAGVGRVAQQPVDGGRARPLPQQFARRGPATLNETNETECYDADA